MIPQVPCIGSSEKKTEFIVGSVDALHEAVPYFLQSEKDYLALEMHPAVMDVQYYLSVVYHNLGLPAEREEAAKRHFATQAMCRELETSDETTFIRILEVVRTVGGALSQR